MKNSLISIFVLLVSGVKASELPMITVPVVVVNMAFDDGTGATRGTEFFTSDLEGINTLWKPAGIKFNYLHSVQLNTTRFRDPSSDDRTRVGAQTGINADWDEVLSQIPIPEKVMLIFYPNTLPGITENRQTGNNRAAGFAHWGFSAVIFQDGTPGLWFQGLNVVAGHEMGHAMNLWHALNYQSIPEDERNESMMDQTLYDNTDFRLHPVLILASRTNAVHSFNTKIALQFSSVKVVDSDLEIIWLIEPGFIDQLQSSTDFKTWTNVGDPWLDYNYFDCVHREPITTKKKFFRVVRFSAGIINPSSLPGI